MTHRRIHLSSGGVVHLPVKRRSEGGFEYKHVVYDSASRTWKTAISEGHPTNMQASLHFHLYSTVWRRKHAKSVALFGSRIVLTTDGAEYRGVIKIFLPYTKSGFGIVFDAFPDTVYYEDLTRPGRNDWKIVPWEDGLFDSMHLRPICPRCGHPLSQGMRAWKLCRCCKMQFPGTASDRMQTRMRGTEDPYRKEPIHYEDDF